MYPMTETCAARGVFYWSLREAEANATLSPQIAKVLHHYNTWATMCGSKFYQFHKIVGNRPQDMEYRCFLESIFNETSQYFAGLEHKHSEAFAGGTDPQKTGPQMDLPEITIDFWKRSGMAGSSLRTFYAQLVCAHVNVNCHSLHDAEARIAAGNKRNDGRIGSPLPDDLYVERAFIYADNVPLVVEDMRRRGFETADVRDAWWTLMLRGQCWAMGTTRLGGKYGEVSSHYYGSPTRVYIL